MAKKQDKDNMSFLEHLEELRWHLVRSFLAIVVIAILAFIFRDIVFDRIILAPKTPEFFTNRNFCSFSKLVNVPALCMIPTINDTMICVVNCPAILILII